MKPAGSIAELRSDCLPGLFFGWIWMDNLLCAMALSAGCDGMRLHLPMFAHMREHTMSRFCVSSSEDHARRCNGVGRLIGC